MINYKISGVFNNLEIERRMKDINQIKSHKDIIKITEEGL